jgi:hypothetical protein
VILDPSPRFTLGLAACAWLAIGGAPRTAAPAKTASAAVMPATADHSYRVVGRAKLMSMTLFANDIGGGRLSWRRGRASESISLLVGSEPERAPRNLNEWAYSLEEIHGDRANAFVVRSLGPADRLKSRADSEGKRQFRAVCSSATGVAAQSATTTIGTDGVITYRALGKLLDHFTGARPSQPRDVVQPSGAAPGFLSALNRMLRLSIEAEASSSKIQPAAIPYTYNSAVYDLQLRRVRRQNNVSVGGRTYGELLQGEFVTVRRRDRDPTPFTVSYAVEGADAGVPIVISYRASWWLSVDLQIDDEYEAPTDPAGDAALSAQIREICAPTWAWRSPE